MTKTEMTTLLRSVGVNENTITAMENAYEMGMESGRDSIREELDPLVARMNVQIVSLEKQLRERT
jgi:hypothetical protein